MELIILLIFLTLSTYLNLIVKFRKHRKEQIKSQMSGFEVSRKILDSYDLNNIYITESKQSIQSHYDPEREVIRLVNGVFNDTSISSCAISAVQASYAIQNKRKDKLFLFRRKLMPYIKTLLYIGYFILAIGILFGHMQTIYLGIALEYFVLIFHIATYKIEKDALELAKKELIKEKIITKKELEKVAVVLKSNSFSYIASIVFPIVELFKSIVEFGDSNK